MVKMVQIIAYFDEHHAGSAASIARIMADNWPAMKISVTDGHHDIEYAQGPEGLYKIMHSCEFCEAALKDALG